MTIDERAAKVAEYERLLRQHDWWFDFSDDHNVWSRGNATLQVLRRMQAELDPDKTIWNRHMPSMQTHSP